MTPKRELLGEFDAPDKLIAAAKAMRARGYTRLDAYTPYPLHEFDEALGMARSKLPRAVLVGALVGVCGAYLAQYWIAAVDYPLNVGGRPAHNPLAFVPITFEMGVLLSALTAFVGVFILAGLPRLWHPVFEVPGFERATIDRFWLAVDARDPKFDRARTEAELSGEGALQTAYTGTDGP